MDCYLKRKLRSWFTCTLGKWGCRIRNYLTEQLGSVNIHGVCQLFSKVRRIAICIRAYWMLIVDLFGSECDENVIWASAARHTKNNYH